MDSPRVLKKYANRRIYDTHTSQYVTLEELAGIIRKGNEVKILDAKTKEDVTAYILTQIVLDRAKNNNALLPPPILHLVIQYGDNILMEFFENYLQQIVRNYIQYKQAVDAQFKRWLDMGMGLSSAGTGISKATNPFAAFFPAPSADPQSDEE